jgi:Na+/phosphate symporter
MTLKESQFGRVSRLVYHPLVMFTIGAAITMISMSVSLSLSILVPLSNRGYIRRENVIPYILGANITTFIDTLFAASLLGNPSVFGIVLISMISITIVSITLLLTIFRPYQYRINRLVYQITSNNRNMAIFLLLIFMIPLVMIFI